MASSRLAIRALLVGLVLAGCGGNDSGYSGANTQGGGGEGGAPKATKIHSPSSGPGMVPAQDVAEVKQALQIIRSCRPGRAGRALHDAVTTVIVTYQSDGPDAHYESNDTFWPTNMRKVAEQVRATLQRCRATQEVRRLDAILAST